MTIKTKAQVEEINRIRNHKLYKELMQRDVSLYMDNALENDMILNMGPQHPATHGVLRVVLRLDGEVIMNAVPEMGYLHRGYEKLAENSTFHEFIPHTDRMDYVSPMSNNVAVVLAIEKHWNRSPACAQWIRTLVLNGKEFFAFVAHVRHVLTLVLCRCFFGLKRKRKTYDLFQEICGARFTQVYTYRRLANE